MSERSLGRRILLERYRLMNEAYKSMTDEQRSELRAWEEENVDGCAVGTADWPGWRDFVPDLPELGSTPQPRRDRTPKAQIPSALRWAIWERDNFTCQMCGSRTNLSIDHIIPESKGGTLEADNLQTLCCRCNSSKGNRA